MRKKKAGSAAGVAGRLRQLREDAGLSQADLAKLAGVPAATIKNIEQERRPDPRWSTVQALAKALKVSVAEFE